MAQRAKYDFEEDVSRVIDSIKNKMGKEYRIDASVTVGKALSEIWGNLDIALLGASKEHIAQRINVVNAAIDRLGFDREKKVSEVLGPEYLIHLNLRDIIVFKNTGQYRRFLKLAEETRFVRKY
ncbi:MAG: hypothetical protein GTN36_01115 [Candidatus Aenigmarchaeota archaeon]|nr:hypothetical protein [Candidatus Aenigmarchaeota archaeon]